MRRGLDGSAERWQDCSSRLVVAACEDPAHHRRFRLTRCEQRICPWCARKQAAKEVARLCELIETLQRSRAFDQGRKTNRPSFKMLTLTLVPSGDLRADFRKLSWAWKELQKRVGFERDKRARLFGAFSALELGPSGNPHIHVLYWGRFVPKQLLQDTWQAITGTSFVVEIHQVRGSYRDAAREVAKYVTKVSAYGLRHPNPDAEPVVPERQLVDLLVSLKGRRRLATHGIFYGVKLVEPDTLDLCTSCSARMHHVGVFAPEHLKPWELDQYFAGPSPPSG